jgi:hypothetical protein
MTTIKMKRLSKSETFKRVKINPSKLISTLRAIGNAYCHSVSKERWSPKNPTKGYCYKLSEVASYQLKNLGISHSIYQIKNKRSNHWFILLEDGSVIDLMNSSRMPYQSGVRRNFFPVNSKSGMSLGADAIAKGLGIL